MSKKNLSWLLGITTIGALVTYQFVDMENGYWWIIPFGLAFLGWYLIWLILKQPKTKTKTVNFNRGGVLFLYDNKPSQRAEPGVG